ncbi:MAG: cytochrome P450 [Bacteroidota bacterium]
MTASKASIPNYRGRNYLARNREFFRDPLHFAVDKYPDFGDFFRSHLLLRNIFFVSRPEGIKQVLQTQQKHYRKSPAYDQLKLALGNGLVTSEGDFWRQQRRLAQPAFYKTQLEAIYRMMQEVTEKYLDDFAQRQERQTTFNIAEEMMKVTADIVLASLFHARLEEGGDTYDKLYRTVHDTQEYILYCVHHPHLIPWTYLNGQRRQFFRDLRVFDDIVYRMIEERERSDQPPPDLLTMLIQARDADTGQGMTARQLRDEAITIFAAGHETSANALSWTLYLLVEHPAILARLREEVDAVLGDRTPTMADLRELTYTKQVIEEGMRHYPPAWALGREALQDTEILGERIPRKSIVFMNVYALHHHPEYWEAPQRFDPDRFAPERVKQRSRWQYLPFGAGPRMCIGNHFALMEMQLLLALLVRRYDFQLVSDRPVAMQPLITLKPKGGIWMRAKKRQPQPLPNTP